ncbi:MAG: hydroxyethylthiazole kinase [Ruminococcus sp.]|nr:hydroxyethylthiazole kinase [Ruminococcus sp.]
MFKEILGNVRTVSPLIHNITNYVTANDCANILLACGGSPIMADDPEEVEEITSLCGGLNINIGTLNKRTIPSMHKAGKRANELGHPVVLDPVGAGASVLRTQTAVELVQDVKFTVIRGNISEIKTLAAGCHALQKKQTEALIEESGASRGVDANVADTVTRENLPQTIAFIKEFARMTNSVIVVTGAIDIVADDTKAYCIFNGHPMMSSITGTGCQLSSLITAYITANPAVPLEAAAAAVCAMGVCGEKAHQRLSKLDGNASYRNYIIDAVYNLDGEELERCARYEIYE